MALSHPSPPNNPVMSPEEYLAFERSNDERHEYIHGRVYAMAGASENHNLIIVNLAAAFHGQFRKRNCKAYVESMRVQAGKNYVYPDAAALCGDARLADDKFDTLVNPQIVIEVLSPSTRRIDKYYKAHLYRQISSLQEYLLIAQNVPHVEQYIRQDDNTWLLRDIVGLDATVKIAAVDVTLALADIYEKVTFPEEDTE